MKIYFLNKSVLHLLICFGCYKVCNGRIVYSLEGYNTRRQQLVQEEETSTFGHNVHLTEIEESVNTLLMKAKYDEYDNGFANLSNFNSAYHFFVRKPMIEKSDVFKFIKNMPKGSALHVHDSALIGGEYLLTITYEPNLYACYVEGKIQFKFMRNAKQETSCYWELMRDIRQRHGNVRELDSQLLQLFTLERENPTLDNYEIWRDFQNIFGLNHPLLSYKPIREKYIYEALKQYRNDNVMYLEVRTSLPNLYDLDGNTYDAIECAKLLKTVSDRFKNDFPDSYGMRIILAPTRRVNNTVVHNYVETLKNVKRQLGNFVAGFDLVGQEDLGYPLIDFVGELMKIPEDFDLFFHAGETNWYGTSTDQNLIDAVLLGSKRLGHGYALVKHPAVAEIVKAKDIAVEVNPLSNQVLGYVADFRNHPASHLFAENYPLVISSDDPGLWGALPMSHDLYEAFMGIASRNSDIRVLKKLCMNSIQYSSLPKNEIPRVLQDFETRWMEYMERYYNEHNMNMRYSPS